MTFVVEKATSVPVQRPLYLKAGLRNGRWDGRTWWVPDIDEAFCFDTRGAAVERARKMTSDAYRIREVME